jgi:hypothetical protein
MQQEKKGDAKLEVLEPLFLGFENNLSRMQDYHPFEQDYHPY